MTPKRGQRSSDPLPYVQVDRAVKTKAASLAAELKVTTQHAMGALVDFWELCGDPRELERLALAGVEEVVLHRDEVARRFKLASGGYTIDPADLAALGLLEVRPADEFRVRGMSRYFKPIRRRLHARGIAVAGGKARAEGARDGDGRFTGGGAPAGPPAGGQGGALAGVGLDTPHPDSSLDPANRQPIVHPAASQPSSTAGSVQRASTKEVRARAPCEVGKPTRPPRKPSANEEFFAWTQAEANKRQPGRASEGPPHAATLNSQMKPAAAAVGRKGLELAWLHFLNDPWARDKGWPWSVFVSQWEKHHNAAIAVANASGGAPTLQVIR